MIQVLKERRSKRWMRFKCIHSSQVSSRFVVQVMSVYLIIFGVILKLGAVFAAMPEPIIGGVIAITIGRNL